LIPVKSTISTRKIGTAANGADGNGELSAVNVGAAFANRRGLSREAGGAFRATDASGEALYQPGATGQRGPSKVLRWNYRAPICVNELSVIS